MASTRCINTVSAARLFVHISRQSASRAATTARVPVCEFLLPTPPPCSARPRQWRALGTASRAQSAASAAGRGVTRYPGSRSRTRPFSTSVPRRATQAILNPQTDEDGNEMMLEITPRAAKRLSEVMAKDANPYLALRVQVESGGCHGFQYLMSLVTLPPSLPTATPAGDPTGAIRDDDTIFAYAAEEQGQQGETTGAEGGGKMADLMAPKIILDSPSLELLKGSKVDFTMELIGSQFKIADNPHATSSCGCGTSFDIKV